MEKNSFRLSAVALSVLFGLSATAMAASVSSVSVPDVSTLSKNNGYYSGGGSVFIGGSDLATSADVTTGRTWQKINTNTAGFNSLVNSSGYLGYLDESAATLARDANHSIDEDYERSLHGQRQVSFLTTDGRSRPTNIVQGLQMGTAENRYTKRQSVTLYQRDASGNIQYQKDADGNDVLDTAGNRIPLTVSKTIELDRNSDVYIRTAETIGGTFGLADATLYSKVKSFSGDEVAAVTTSGLLYETSWNGHARDVLSVTNSIIDNTLSTDSYVTNPALEGSSEEQIYSERPYAVGMAINHTGVNWMTDSAGNQIESSSATNIVPANANIVLDKVQITAQNLAAVREDDHYANNQNNYSYSADTRSTALAIGGSGLFATLNESKLTGGVNGAGQSLTLSGHANRADISASTLNGNITLAHDGYKPVITVTVKRDDKGNYYVTGAASANSLQRIQDGTTLNVTGSEINGDITASGVAGYEIQLVDVTDSNAQVNIAPTVHSTAQAIYNNAISSINQTVLGNASNAWTPVSINLSSSTLNGGVTGTTTLNTPVQYSHDSGERVLTWNPDLTLNGSVWNAAADANATTGLEVKVSNVHDLNLTSSTLNLVNLNEDTATLGDKNRYENLSTARVIVHNNLSQNKDTNGQYLASTINVGKSVVDPLLNLSGSYTWGSMQVKGSAAGNYLLHIASSGVEPYVKNGYLADSATVDPHSFVNYKDAGSDAYFYGQTELGVYQYVAVNEYDDTLHGERNVYFKNNGKLSNSAATAVSLPAAQANVASLDADALTKHLNTSRHAADDGGVWLAWFGGKNENKVAGDAAYSLKTNGLMLGVDNRFDAAKGGNWLAGVAFSSSRSDLDVKNSSGDIDSYGAQFYLSRRYDNGVFVDTQAQFNHFSNSADVRMLDGGKAHAEYTGNGYGLAMAIGYTWQQDGFFAEPYVKATGRTFDGAQYTLSNGMVVNSNDYHSVQGELGANLGYTFSLSEGYLKPYLHLAAINEFADDNQTRINNVTLNNSIDGAAFQIGTGAELKFNNGISGYAGFDYTKGGDIERPWQATLGVNYSW